MARLISGKSANESAEDVRFVFAYSELKAKTCQFKFPGPGRHSTPVAALRTTLLVVLRLNTGKCAQHAANDVQTVITTHSEVYDRIVHFKFPGPVKHPRGRPAHHPAREAPGRATCPA